MPARPRSISRDGGRYFSLDRSDGSSQAVHQGVTDGLATRQQELASCLFAEMLQRFGLISAANTPLRNNRH
jgi:hypothetical protein